MLLRKTAVVFAPAILFGLYAVARGCETFCCSCCDSGHHGSEVAGCRLVYSRAAIPSRIHTALADASGKLKLHHLHEQCVWMVEICSHSICACSICFASCAAFDCLLCIQFKLWQPFGSFEARFALLCIQLKPWQPFGSCASHCLLCIQLDLWLPL